MTRQSRRSFLRRAGATVGALTFGADAVTALVYQKRGIVRREPEQLPPDAVDFRYAPQQWHLPLRRHARDPRSFMTASGGLVRPGGALSLELALEGAGGITAVSHRCEAPHQPSVRSVVSYGEQSLELHVFSSHHEDEETVDSIVAEIVRPATPLTLRIRIESDRPLRTEIREDDDLPRGRACLIRREGMSDPPILILDAEPEIARDGAALVLAVPVPAGADPAGATFRLRLPSGDGDTGDIVEGSLRLDERAASERAWWDRWQSGRGPAGWSVPGSYGAFLLAGARLIDQLEGAAAPALREGEARRTGQRPVGDLVDQHFLSEAEYYLGRDAEARARLERVWNGEYPDGFLVGAGGPGNMKELCAAVYSLCRHAELSGDWKLFNELYPDAFIALDGLKLRRDKAASVSAPGPNGARNLLPEGSPGRGWEGEWEEMTNSLWAMIALKPMLEISDRFFLVKKSELREFYGQMRLAFVQAARDMLRRDPGGHSFFPMVSRRLGTDAPGPAPPLQAGLGVFAAGLYPGLLFGKEEVHVRDFPAIVRSCLVEEVPSGTGPGGAGALHLPDAPMVAQALIWFGLPEEARTIFIGCLNHAAPVYLWDGGGPEPGGAGRGAADLRLHAEAIRTVRHTLVLEDNEILRLLDGIGRADLEPALPIGIENTPTRWGRVSVRLEPVDHRTWKLSYRREPHASGTEPPLKSVELPRVLAPNFRFDTVAPGTAIKNGPRVIVESTNLAWEAMFRDLRR